MLDQGSKVAAGPDQGQAGGEARGGWTLRFRVRVPRVLVPPPLFSPPAPLAAGMVAATLLFWVGI